MQRCAQTQATWHGTWSGHGTAQQSATQHSTRWAAQHEWSQITCTSYHRQLLPSTQSQGCCTPDCSLIQASYYHVNCKSQQLSSAILHHLHDRHVPAPQLHSTKRAACTSHHHMPSTGTPCCYMTEPPLLPSQACSLDSLHTLGLQVCRHRVHLVRGLCIDQRWLHGPASRRLSHQV